MTQSEAQAATMILDVEDIDAIWNGIEDPETDTDPSLDTTEGEELLLGVTSYS